MVGRCPKRGSSSSGRPKTPKEQSTVVSSPHAEDPDVEAHAEDATQEEGSSSNEMKVHKKKDALHAFHVIGFKYRRTEQRLWCVVSSQPSYR